MVHIFSLCFLKSLFFEGSYVMCKVNGRKLTVPTNSFITEI